MTDGDRDRDWTLDRVRLRDGAVLPVRATARRPTWDQLPARVRREIETAAGARVVDSWSAGTGFTPGFASRLDLANGDRIFVKAASTADDRRHGWPMSDAYREEARKLPLLSSGVGSPPLLWVRSFEVGADRWIVLGFMYVDGAPPRRPWRRDELQLVLDKFAESEPAFAQVPAELGLEPLVEHLVTRADSRLQRVRQLEGDSVWLATVERLCADASRLLVGDRVVHMDLRDDNVLIGVDGRVWFVDWNWPVVGPAWVDLVCLLLSARGDGHDVEGVIATHPLTRHVDAAAITCLLAVLWSFWAAVRHEEAPQGSPHLRDHQRWYADVTREWLEERLSRYGFVRLGSPQYPSAQPDESHG